MRKKIYVIYFIASAVRIRPKCKFDLTPKLKGSWNHIPHRHLMLIFYRGIPQYDSRDVSDCNIDKFYCIIRGFVGFAFV